MKLEYLKLGRGTGVLESLGIAVTAMFLHLMRFNIVYVLIERDKRLTPTLESAVFLGSMVFMLGRVQAVFPYGTKRGVMIATKASLTFIIILLSEVTVNCIWIYGGIGLYKLLKKMTAIFAARQLPHYAQYCRESAFNTVRSALAGFMFFTMLCVTGCFELLHQFIKTGSLDPVVQPHHNLFGDFSFSDLPHPPKTDLLSPTKRRRQQRNRARK